MWYYVYKDQEKWMSAERARENNPSVAVQQPRITRSQHQSQLAEEQTKTIAKKTYFHFFKCHYKYGGTCGSGWGEWHTPGN